MLKNGWNWLKVLKHVKDMILREHFIISCAKFSQVCKLFCQDTIRKLKAFGNMLYHFYRVRPMPFPKHHRYCCGKGRFNCERGITMCSVLYDIIVHLKNIYTECTLNENKNYDTFTPILLEFDFVSLDQAINLPFFITPSA